MHIFYLIFFLLWCGDGDFVLRYLIFNVMIGLPLMFQLFPHISIIPNYFLMPALRSDIFAFFKYLPVCNEFPLHFMIVLDYFYHSIFLFFHTVNLLFLLTVIHSLYHQTLHSTNCSNLCALLAHSLLTCIYGSTALLTPIQNANSCSAAVYALLLPEFM